MNCKLLKLAVSFFVLIFLAPFATVAAEITVSCGADNQCTQNQACTCTADCTGFLLALYSSSTSINFDWQSYTSTNSIDLSASQPGTKYVKALCDNGERSGRQQVSVQAAAVSPPQAPSVAGPSTGTIDICMGLYCPGQPAPSAPSGGGGGGGGGGGSTRGTAASGTQAGAQQQSSAAAGAKPKETQAGQKSAAAPGIISGEKPGQVLFSWPVVLVFPVLIIFIAVLGIYFWRRKSGQAGQEPAGT